MKNQTLNKVKTSVKSMFTPITFALIILANVLPVTTHAEEKKPEKSIAAAVDVKYLGSVGSQPIFEMNIDNVLEDVLYLTLKDEDGNVLYGAKLTSKKISKTFRFENIDLNNLNVTVSLFSKNNKVM